MDPSSLGLHNKDQDFSKNLNVLSAPLQKNQRIFAKKGHLKTKDLSFFQRIVYNVFQKRQNEKKVKAVIDNFVTQIEYDKNELKEVNEKLKNVDKKLKALGRPGVDNKKARKIRKLEKKREELLEKKEKLSKEQQNLNTLLFNRMNKLSLKIYDRSKLPKSAIYKLDPSLKEAKEKKKEFKSSLERLKSKEAKEQDPIKKAALEKKRAVHERKIALAQVDRRIQKVQIAQKLGVSLTPIGKGMSGSYFARDYKGKIKGVFKPASEESLTGTSPKLMDRIKRVFIRCLPIESPASAFHSREGYLAEVFTTTLATHLRFHTVPASAIAELATPTSDNAKGSFQVFVKDTKSAQDALHKLSKSEIENLFSQEEFEELAAIDFLIYNRDRHFENWLVSENDNAEGQKDIYLIDHGLSFPKKNPSQKDVLYRRNQFKWASLPQAERAFSKEMAERLLRRLSGDNLDKLMERFLEADDRADADKSFNRQVDGTSQAEAFLQRVDVLKKCLAEEWSIRDLAAIKTQEDIDRVLS